MARSANQKLKILYIMDLLLRQSDQEHPIPLQQILEHLDAHNISAERKSIYADLTALKDYGVDILSSRKGYWVASRDFELPELKLLVDSVQSSKFITYKKTLSLIKKLERLGNVHDARQLNRQVYIQNRVKAMNESIYYNVDKLHTAIDQNRQIRFHYFEYNIQKERVLRHDGAWYTISPLALAQDDENYYLVSYDSAAQCIKHFRVDKMTDIQVTKLSRDGLKVSINSRCADVIPTATATLPSLPTWWSAPSSLPGCADSARRRRSSPPPLWWSGWRLTSEAFWPSIPNPNGKALPSPSVHGIIYVQTHHNRFVFI